MRAAFALVWRAAPVPLLGLALLTLTTALLPVATAWLTKALVDAVVGGSPVVLLGTGVALAGVGLGVLPHLAAYLRAELDRRVGLTAQDRLFTAVNRLVGIERFEDPEFLDRLRLAQQSGATAPARLVAAVLGGVAAVVSLVAFAGSLVALSALAAVAVLLSTVPTLVAELKLSGRRAMMFWLLGPIERRELFYGLLLSTVQAAKEVRLFGIGGYLKDRMLTERRAADRTRRGMDRRELRAQGGLSLLGGVVSGLGLVWAVTAARRGEVSAGGLLMFIASVTGLQRSAESIMGSIAEGHQQLLGFGHYRAAVRAGTASSPAAARVPALRRGIEFRDVWFRYSAEHPWVLRGASFTIPHGRATALVGRNGAGKSTVVKLLCRFYDPSRGAVLWDGVDLRDLDPAQLRDRMGAVFQDFMNYDLTATENIALGDLTALRDRGRLADAAGRAGVHETLSGLPAGYDTMLSRMFADGDATGVQLSGGQWQRLALARALLRGDRDLLVLDEPSSGLDAEAEHELHTTLRGYRAGRTSLLISHRLGAIRDADRIVVLAGGAVCEEGTHAGLVARDGEYARLFALQAAGYQELAEVG
jgi:ATP-binding cassette, subfamily B, bacterial